MHDPFVERGAANDEQDQSEHGSPHQVQGDVEIDSALDSTYTIDAAPPLDSMWPLHYV